MYVIIFDYFIIIIIDGNICFYGKCRLCQRASIACAKDGLMEGAVILWLPKSYKLRKWNNPFRHSTRSVYDYSI